MKGKEEDRERPQGEKDPRTWEEGGPEASAGGTIKKAEPSEVTVGQAGQSHVPGPFLCAVSVAPRGHRGPVVCGCEPQGPKNRAGV